MRHDIADFPEGTGTSLGPGILWQGGQVLLQPLELSLEDCDIFCLCKHDAFPPWGCQEIPCDFALVCCVASPSVIVTSPSPPSWLPALLRVVQFSHRRYSRRSDCHGDPAGRCGYA